MTIKNLCGESMGASKSVLNCIKKFTHEEFVLFASASVPFVVLSRFVRKGHQLRNDSPRAPAACRQDHRQDHDRWKTRRAHVGGCLARIRVHSKGTRGRR